MARRPSRRLGCALSGGALTALALVALWWFQPPRPSEIPEFEVVPIEPIRRSSTLPPVGTQAAADPIPSSPTSEEDEYEDILPESWRLVEDRADWRGGGIVECDLSSVAPGTAAVTLDPAGSMTLASSIDPLSHFTSPKGGLLRFTTTEPDGVILASLSDRGLLSDEEPTSNQLARISWSGADPGETVRCSRVEIIGRSELIIHLIGHDFSDGVTTPALYVRACGNAAPPYSSSLRLKVEPGRCRVQVERRNVYLPLARVDGEPFFVDIGENEVVEIEIPVPDEPPVWTLPVWQELTTFVDLASWAGSAALTQAADQLVKLFVSGSWEEDSVNEALESSREEVDPDGTDELLLHDGDTLDED